MSRRNSHAAKARRRADRDARARLEEEVRGILAPEPCGFCEVRQATVELELPDGESAVGLCTPCAVTGLRNHPYDIPGVNVAGPGHDLPPVPEPVLDLLDEMGWRHLEASGSMGLGPADYSMVSIRPCPPGCDGNTGHAPGDDLRSWA